MYAPTQSKVKLNDSYELYICSMEDIKMKLCNGFDLMLKNVKHVSYLIKSLISKEQLDYMK